MIKRYTPNALMKEAAHVIKQHPLSSRSQAISDSDLIDLLERVVNCKSYDLPTLAFSLLPKEISALCQYLPQNKYNKATSNIIRVISLNMASTYWEMLFDQWQKFPYNRPLFNLLAEHDTVQIRGEHAKIPVGSFAAWSQSDAIFKEINQYVQHTSNNTGEYSTCFENAGFTPDSPLQRVCLAYYLTTCNLQSYSQIGDVQVARCAQNAETEVTELILLNLLICGASDPKHLSSFKECFTLMQNMWKEPSSGNFPKNQSVAYNIYSWLYKYVEMSSTFSNDADMRRKNFWEKYLNNCDIVRMKHHRMIIFYFRNHCAIEFEVVGRIFVFERDYFKYHVHPYIAIHSDTQDVKNWMRDSSAHDYSQTHQGVWEPKAHQYLRKII